MYEAAKKHYRKYGNLEVSSNYVTEDGEKLGQWISQMRGVRKGTRKHSIVLDEEKIAALDAIGFIWEVSKKNGQRYT